MSCSHLATALDGRGRQHLDADERHALDAHARECAECGREGERRALLHDRLAAAGEGATLPPGFAEQVQRRVRDRLAAPAAAGLGAELDRLALTLWPRAALAALAGAALLAVLGAAELRARPSPGPADLAATLLLPVGEVAEDGVSDDLVLGLVLDSGPGRGAP